jgi:hypothetical protein
MNASRSELLGALPRLSYLSVTATGCLKMLRDLEASGIASFAIDRCPRCPYVVATGSQSVATPDDVIFGWALNRSLHRAPYELYFEHAEDLLDSGDVGRARDVLLEIAGHVTFEEPGVHLLLGEVADQLDDKVLTREAHEFVRLLFGPQSSN